ncbi:MAG: hypothetical protein CMH57_10685 [Myxococcales bacterium]|nr:hypothetical protein [Myxococcales bacterium]
MTQTPDDTQTSDEPNDSEAPTPEEETERQADAAPGEDAEASAEVESAARGDQDAASDTRTASAAEDDPEGGELPTEGSSGASAADATSTEGATSARYAKEAAAKFSELRWSDPAQGQVWRDRGLVLLVAVALLLPLLGSFGLWDPWETHYGEVGRQITERNDWISTWWGSHWKNAEGGQEGTYFYSKPIFLMWMMAGGLELFGFSEWGIRLGVCLLSIGAVVMAYSMGERIWDRRTGFVMAAVLGTSPFFFFLSRQAQTDMPFVGNMTIALCFFMMATFGRDKHAPVTRRGLLAMLGLIGVTVVPQIILIGVGLSRWRQGPNVNAVEAFFYWGPVQAALYSAMLIGVVWATLKSKRKTHQMIFMYGFYVFVATASLSKGLLGFALPGAFIFFYLLLTGQWRRLKGMELLRGIPIFILVAFPWYVAMLVRHGNAYYQRFFIHDHFKRLATGVHQIDSGSFEHYVKWMFYGLWPWGSFLPAAFVRLFVARDDDPGEAGDQHQATFFLLIWLVFSFSLFTLASTKFHHYIFPAVPAAALLVALLIRDLIRPRSETGARPLSWVMYTSALALFALVAWDLIEDPQNLKNLFTYRYDRKWHTPWNAEFQPALGVIASGALVGMLMLGARKLKLRRVGAGVVGVAAAAMLLFCLDVYMPTISSSWSQKGIWDTYYSVCERTEGPPGHDEKKRYCAEQVLSYKLNWRGETYYTQNEVIPIREDDEFDYFIRNNDGRPFYAIMERSRWNGEFKRKLPDPFKGKACAVHEDNIKFVLVRAPCGPGGPAKKDAPPQDAKKTP